MLVRTRRNESLFRVAGREAEQRGCRGQGLAAPQGAGKAGPQSDTERSTPGDDDGRPQGQGGHARSQQPPNVQHRRSMNKREQRTKKRHPAAGVGGGCGRPRERRAGCERPLGVRPRLCGRSSSGKSTAPERVWFKAGDGGACRTVQGFFCGDGNGLKPVYGDGRTAPGRRKAAELHIEWIYLEAHK